MTAQEFKFVKQGAAQAYQAMGVPPDVAEFLFQRKMAELANEAPAAATPALPANSAAGAAAQPYFRRLLGSVGAVGSRARDVASGRAPKLDSDWSDSSERFNDFKADMNSTANEARIAPGGKALLRASTTRPMYSAMTNLHRIADTGATNDLSAGYAQFRNALNQQPLTSNLLQRAQSRK